MKEAIFRKGLVIAIIGCFVGAGVFPSISGNINSTELISTDVLFVDDEGDFGYYTRIGDAIMDASAYDTIMVYSGIYNENIELDINKKGLILEGIDHEVGVGGDTGKPIVLADDTNPVIDISCDEAQIKGFCLQGGHYSIFLYRCYSNSITNCDIKDNQGIKIYESSNNTISDNSIISPSSKGIFLERSSDSNIIKGNTIQNHDDAGIYILSSNNNEISSNNKISNNRFGIYISINSKDNKIIDENIINNNYDDGIAIFGESNRVENNEISDNENNGISLNPFSKDNFVFNNIISSNKNNGIYIEFSNGNIISSKNTLIQYIENNMNGIYIINSSDNELDGNTIRFNEDDGIYLLDSNHNNIYSNDVESNNEDGIVIKGDESLYNNIYYNTVNSNGGAGIYLPYADYNYIIGNYLYFNDGEGIALDFVSRHNNVSYNIIESNSCGIGIGWYSNKNTISRNSISSKAGGGISMIDSDYNEIFGNDISDCDLGISGCISCENNLFYHNSFNHNIQNADMDGDNYWDNGYPSGGNYWDDFDEPSEGAYDNYKGEYQDEDGSDGIIDLGPPSGGLNPYIVSEGNIDRYPLKHHWGPPYKPNRPTGPTVGTVGDKYTYETKTIDPNGDRVQYGWDWDGDKIVDWWTDYFESDEICQISHTWEEKGNYTISVIASDECASISPWSDPLLVSMPKNKPYINRPFPQFLQNLMQRFPLLARLLQLPVFDKLLNR